MRAHMSMSLALLVPSLALAAPGESSFTPTSLRVPIRGVFLSNATGSATELYHCDDADPCLVDMADAAALSALFTGSVDVKPGTYDSINFGHCLPGAPGYESHVSGHVELDGTTYYTTRAGGQVLTTDSTLLDEVALPHAGCGSSVALPGPITIAKGEEITISAFFSLRNITWASFSTNGIGGCVNSTVGTQSLCTSYPIPVAYLGDVSPVLETYYITEDQTDIDAVKAGGQMLILKDAMNHPFGGFARRLYSATSVQPSVSYDTPIKSIAAGAHAGSYEIDTWGGGGPGGVAIENYIRFPAFELMSHDASLVRGDGGGNVLYRAVKQ